MESIKQSMSYKVSLEGRMWNPKVINTDIALYTAIAEAIERDVRAGILKPGEKMPPQRTLARVVGVNLTTVTRAYREAEKRGLIYGTTGSGTYVCSPETDPRMGRSNRLPEPSMRSNLIDMGLVGSLVHLDPPFSSMLHQVAKDDRLAAYMNYTPSQGLLHQREIAAQWLTRYGLESGTGQIVICAGAMHAIMCSMLALFEPGDRIATDALTFTGMKSIAKMTRMRLEGIQMDEEGMIPEALEQACKKGNVKGVYLMPNCQNPTATAMSFKRKEAIAEIIRTYNLILMEDDIYNFMNAMERTSVTALVPDNGIYINGVSKAFYPGLRVAFVSVPKNYVASFSQAVANTMWMAPTLNVEMICRLLASGESEKIIEVKRKAMASRQRMAWDKLKGHDFKANESSPFIWLNLPCDWKSADFEEAARAQGVGIISSHKFHVGNSEPPNAVRLSLGTVVDERELAQGIDILLKLLHREVDCLPPVF